MPVYVTEDGTTLTVVETTATITTGSTLLPSVTGHAGSFLRTDGASLSWSGLTTDIAIDDITCDTLTAASLTVTGTTDLGDTLTMSGGNVVLTGDQNGSLTVAGDVFGNRFGGSGEA